MSDIKFLDTLKEVLLERGFPLNIVQEILKTTQTIDAVEVIRCHECIGKSTWLNDPEYGCAVCGMSGMYPKNENGYCSYAIRKDNKK